MVLIYRVVCDWQGVYFDHLIVFFYPLDISDRMKRFIVNGSLVVVLTAFTQVGGVAWLLAIWLRHTFLAFLSIYIALSILAAWIAPLNGRVAVSCWSSGPLQVQSWFYCLSNRTYVTEEMAGVLDDVADVVNKEYPGTVTLLLDASFPFFDGFPLLPHLSHDDGEKADLAFYYRDDDGYQAGRTRSPIGYFSFEQGATTCPDNWLSMRWNMRLLQPYWAQLDLDAARTRFLIEKLASDRRVSKIFVEPHLTQSLGVEGRKIRFQGCRAARHDDHIHFQL